MEITDNIKITSNHGFIYGVVVKHHPEQGFSAAYYNDRIIGSREYGKMLLPVSDDDKEWEEWEERFREWADAAIIDLERKCQIEINRLEKLDQL